MNSPFTSDTNRALRTHDSFVMAALAVGARRVAGGKPAGQDVGGSLQPCNNVPPVRTPEPSAPVADLPREKHRLPCPHCEQPAVIRTSVQMSRLMREYMYCCTNPECGHTFVAITEVVRTLSPSATPDPSVSLPWSTHVRRDLLRTQLDSEAPAEHSPRFTRPVTGDLFAAAPQPPATT